MTDARALSAIAMFQEVPTTKIKVSPNRRAPSASRVRQLADSILESGLLHPIGLTEDYRLIHGRHRLEAWQLLGRDKIPAIIYAMDEVRAELAEIDENLCRHA